MNEHLIFDKNIFPVVHIGILRRILLILIIIRKPSGHRKKSILRFCSIPHSTKLRPFYKHPFTLNYVPLYPHEWSLTPAPPIFADMKHAGAVRRLLLL